MKTKDIKGKRPPAPRQAKPSAAAQSHKKRPAAKKANYKPHDTEIVYTQAKPFVLSTFLLRLLTVVAVVAALVLGMSIFFKVGEVNVAGGTKYTPWEVMQASGIQEGENLLTLNKSRVVGKIKTQLPYVDEVRIGIKLPDTVNIEITELSVTYAIQEDGGDWWLMDAEGKLLEPIQAIDAKFCTQVLGITVTEPQAGQQAVATEPEPETIVETNAAGESTEVALPVTVYGQEKLNAALAILQSLEENSILGEMESVDVSDMGNIELWYGDRYNILMGDATQISRKVRSFKLAIDQLSEYQTGILDVSFTIWPDQVGYTSFDQE